MTPGDLIRETLQKQLTINQVNRLVRQLFVLQGDEGERCSIQSVIRFHTVCFTVFPI